MQKTEGSSPSQTTMDWSIRCNCGKKFSCVHDYAEHMAKHPQKCARCKLWFNSITSYISHECKKAGHAESGG